MRPGKLGNASVRRVCTRPGPLQLLERWRARMKGHRQACMVLATHLGAMALPGCTCDDALHSRGLVLRVGANAARCMVCTRGCVSGRGCMLKLRAPLAWGKGMATISAARALRYTHTPC